ncbi:Uncharacterised protein [Serratia grimesii]|nr:Uncharacterised protein [Serratia grimesii]
MKTGVYHYFRFSAALPLILTQADCRRTSGDQGYAAGHLVNSDSYRNALGQTDPAERRVDIGEEIAGGSSKTLLSPAVRCHLLDRFQILKIINK